MPQPAAPSRSASQPLLAGLGPLDAASMAARCGDDVVPLLPVWPAVVAATRFARRARWVFGNRAASLECLEPHPRRWLTQRCCDDPVQVHFDLGRWSSAYARSEGRSREIDVFAADGSAIAALRLDDADAALDELLWLLVDDRLVRAAAPAHVYAAPPASERIDRGFDVAQALTQAFAAELPLRFVVHNGGGRVAWTPRGPLVSERDGTIDVRSARVRLTIGDRAAAGWSVGLTAATDAQRAAWHRICGDRRSNV